MGALSQARSATLGPARTIQHPQMRSGTVARGIPTASWRRSQARQARRLTCSCGATLLLFCLTACDSGHKAGPAIPTTIASQTPVAALAQRTPIATNDAVPPPPTVTRGVSSQILGDLQAGRALVQAQCAACHALTDAGLTGSSPPVAPALDGIGRRRSRQWLELQLVNPCAHPHAGGSAFSCSQMPSFSELTPGQRDQLVRYLLSLR